MGSIMGLLGFSAGVFGVQVSGGPCRAVGGARQLCGAFPCRAFHAVSGAAGYGGRPSQ